MRALIVYESMFGNTRDVTVGPLADGELDRARDCGRCLGRDMEAASSGGR